MTLFFGILIGLFTLVILVVIHELGHAIVARRNGVIVEEFGIGFPPKAWAKKLKNGILFTINWLPIGGFVKLKGEHDSDDKKGDYGAASYWQKTKILLAGVAVNWAFAAVLFTILAWVGLPKIIDNQFMIPSDTRIVSTPVTISEVQNNSPAKEAGLKAGDEILAINGEKITSLTDFTNQIKSLGLAPAQISYSRDGKESQAEINLRQNNERGAMGVSLMGATEKYRATWSAPIVGVVTTVQLTEANFRGLGEMVAKLFTGNAKQAGESVAGPVGILGTLFPSASQAGPASVILLAAIISLALAVMNLLPIPGLDGGRWFTMTIFKLSGKKLTKDIEDNINGTGMLILMTLVVVITIVDIGKLF